RIWMRVVCTLREVIVTLAPTRALTSVDLPALGAPMMAITPQRRAPAASASGAASPGAALGLSANLALLHHTFPLQHRGGGGLLGGPLRGPLATRGGLAPDAHLGGEARRMVGAGTLHLDIARQREPLPLRPFLEC